MAINICFLVQTAHYRSAGNLPSDERVDVPRIPAEFGVSRVLRGPAGDGAAAVEVEVSNTQTHAEQAAERSGEGRNVCV
jgi:hypothetical protein